MTCPAGRRKVSPDGLDLPAKVALKVAEFEMPENGISRAATPKHLRESEVQGKQGRHPRKLDVGEFLFPATRLQQVWESATPKSSWRALAAIAVSQELFPKGTE